MCVCALALARACAEEVFFGDFLSSICCICVCVCARARSRACARVQKIFFAILCQVFVVYKCLHCCACKVTSRFCASKIHKCVFVLGRRTFNLSCTHSISAVVFLQVLLIADAMRRRRTAVL